MGCGYVKPNHQKNPEDVTWVYVVRSRQDLIDKVIPFFKKFELRTSKREDFEKFALIVSLMCEERHKSVEGLKEILHLAFSMNRTGKYRRISLEKILNDLEPSETIRQTFSGASSEAK